MGLLDYLSLKEFCMKVSFPYLFYEKANVQQFLSRSSLPSFQEWKAKDPFAKITQVEYNNSQKIWAKMAQYYASKNVPMTMLQYLTLYQKNDILFLASIIKSVATSYYKEFGIDILQHLSIASFSFAIFIKNLRQRVEVITDVNIWSIYRQAIAGGLCMCSSNYQNRNVPKKPGYDPTKPTKWLCQLDFVSLYPSIAAKYSIAKGDYRLWETEEVKQYFEDMSRRAIWEHWSDERAYMKEDKAYGLTLVCTLSLPEHLHDKFKSLPIFFENRCVYAEECSPTQQVLIKKFRRKPENSKRLLMHLGKIQNAALDFRLLKFYIKEGCCLEGISNIISYELGNYMQKTIRHNAKKRRNATLQYEKFLFKNISSMLVGKFQSAGDKYTSARVIFNRSQLQKCVNDHLFSRYIDLSDDNGSGGIENYGIAILQTKAVKTRFTLMSAAHSILNLSKLHLFETMYNVLAPLYSKHNCLLTNHYNDTDSSLFSVECLQNNPPSLSPSRAPIRSVFEPLWELAEVIDSSNLPSEHPFFNTEDENLKTHLEKLKIKNRKRLGTFSIDTEQEIISYIGLKSKAYSLKLEHPDEKCEKIRLKGVKNCELEFCDFKHFLQSKKETLFVPQCSFVSQKHMKYRRVFKKQALFSLDMKRYTLMPNVGLPFGHYLIPIMTDVYYLMQNILDQVEKCP